MFNFGHRGGERSESKIKLHTENTVHRVQEKLRGMGTGGIKSNGCEGKSHFPGGRGGELRDVGLEMRPRKKKRIK